MAGKTDPVMLAPDALLATLPVPWWDGALEPLGAGLTNSNYRLRLPSGRSYFLRQGHPDPVRLGIDRATEWQLYQGAMAEGLALPCHYKDPASGLMLLEWCDEPNWLEAAPPSPNSPVCWLRCCASCIASPYPPW